MSRFATDHAIQPHGTAAIAGAGPDPSATIAAVAVALSLGTGAIILTAAAVVLGAGAIVQAAWPKAAAELLSQAAFACGGVAFLGDGAIGGGWKIWYRVLLLIDRDVSQGNITFVL
jgi:hypothetical protein